MLEAAQHERNAFVTLTYNKEFVPADGSLVPVDCQLWVKRLRRAVAPSRFRFFLVGEYGDDSWRPHYHAGLFGYPGCAYGQSRYSARIIDCCYWCDLVRDTWGRGHVFVGNLEADSAQYLAGYVTKKMTARDDPRLEGRHPEFGRMSLRPGIGHDAMYDVADILLKYDVDCSVDVPKGLRHGRSILPLGRYLRRRLREMVGEDGKISQGAMDEIAEELRSVRLAARADNEEPSVKHHLMAANRGARDAFVGRSKLYRKEKKL